MGRAWSMDGKYKKFGEERKLPLVDLGINGIVGTMDLTEIGYSLWTRFIECKTGFFVGLS
jgi:hypothetical protein